DAAAHRALQARAAPGHFAGAGRAGRRGRHDQPAQWGAHPRPRGVGAAGAAAAGEFLPPRHPPPRARAGRGEARRLLRFRPVTPLTPLNPLNPPVLFLDFDNTITVGDVLDGIIERFSPDAAWRGWEDEWRAGRLSAADCLSRQVGALRVTREALLG